MELNTLTNTPVSSGARNASASSTSALNSDFDTFLQMLTAQARYQDPLEPIDSTEYAAQLAQFSMVEQQVSTNELMEQMIAAFGASDIGNASNLIGLDALTSAPANFQGSPVVVKPNPPVAADSVQLVIKNTSGTEVQRIGLPVSDETYAWDGRNADGSLLPYGSYTMSIESRADGELLTTDPALTYSRITEAILDNGSMLYSLESGTLVAADQIIGLREPDRS